MSRVSVFGSLCATVFLVNLARVVFAPLLQPVAADFGVTAASLGVLASAVWLGSAFPRLPTGYVLTRVPRHYVIIFTGSLLVVTSTFTGLAQSIPHLIVGAFLMGLSSGMYFIAAQPLVSELFPRKIGRVIGVHGMSNQLAAVSAPIIVGGLILIGDWRSTFFVIAAVAAAATIAIIVSTRRTELPYAGEQDRSLLVAARAQWPIIVTGIVVVGFVGFLWNGLFNLYGDYLETVKGIDAGTGRLLLSVMFAAGVPAWLISGRLADSFRNVPMMVVILVGFSLTVFGLTLVDGIVLIAVLSIGVGYFYFSLPAVMNTYLLATLPDRHRGSAYTWFSAAMMLLTALGSGTIGLAVTWGFAYDAVFGALSILIGIIAVGLFAFYHAGALPRRRHVQ